MKPLPTAARSTLGGGIAVLMAMFLPAKAGGVVSDCNEAALLAAVAGGGTVTFSCSGTILLASTLVITVPTEIDGSGQQVALSGGGVIQVLENRSTTTLRKLTLASGVGPTGAAVRNTGTLTVIDSTFTDHEAQVNSNDGGNGVVSHHGASLTLERCAFWANRVTGLSGSAIVTLGHPLTQTSASSVNVWITNCTFANNSAQTGFIVSVRNGTRAQIEHCSFAANTANTGLFVQNSTPAHAFATLRNSVLGLNAGTNVSGGLTDLGNNFCADLSLSSPAASTFVGMDPLLGPLANNGGPTLTLLPQPGSPLIDTGSVSGTVLLDQRGIFRPQAGYRDIGTVEVENPDSFDSFRFAAWQSTQDESTANMNVTVTRSGAGVGEAQVRIFTEEGSALAGSDFTAIDQVVVFEEGVVSKVVAIPLVNDAEIEELEFLKIRLSSPSAGYTLGYPILSATVRSDDFGFRFEAANYTAAESQGTVNFRVIRNGNLQVAKNLTYSRVGGTAAAGSDYTTGGSIQFAVNQTNANLSVTLVNDSNHEESETVEFTLNPIAANGVILTPATHVLTIQDNDPLTVGFSSSSLSVAEGGGTACLLVERSSGTNGMVSVDYATLPGSAVAGADYTERTGTLVFGDGETLKIIEVPLVGDEVMEGDETFAVTLRDSSAGSAVTVSNATITVRDSVQTLVSCEQAAVEAAISLGGTIRFACDGFVVFSHSIRVETGILLDGNGHDVTIVGAGTNQLFVVDAGNTLDLRGLVLTGGVAMGANGTAFSDGLPGTGGAVEFSGSVLRASDCIFHRNQALGGAGGSTATSSQAHKGGQGLGGALYAQRSCLIMDGCQFSGNISQAGRSSDSIGNLKGSDSYGGALYATGAFIRMNGCEFLANQSRGGIGRQNGYGNTFGGALAVSSCTVEAVDTGWISNHSLEPPSYGTAIRGGAIHCPANSRMHLRNCRISANVAQGGDGFYGNAYPGVAWGAGIWNAGHLTLESCTLDGNLAKAGRGGGVGDVPASGGAIWNQGLLRLVNCTIYRNVAQGGGELGDIYEKMSGLGGGVSNIGGDVQALNCSWVENNARWSPRTQTLLGPVAVQRGGGLYTTNGTVRLENCLFNDNVEGGNIWGAVMDLGHNLSSDATAGFVHPTSGVNTDPLTGPLCDLGGPVPVVPLLAGSPAMDSPGITNCPPTDARGVLRPYGAGCDIGAFEAEPSLVVLGHLAGVGFATGTSLVVRIDGVPATLLPAGWFNFGSTNAGLHAVTPSQPGWVFFPPTQMVNLPDFPGNLNFAAYRVDTLNMTSPAPGEFQLFYPAGPDRDVELFATPSLIPPDWTSLGVFRSGTDGLLTVPLDTSAPSRIYRVEVR